MDLEKIVYTALFIDDPEKLLKMFPSKHEKVFAHHSTIWYKPQSLENLEIGKKSALKIIGQVYDEKAFAILVENKKSKNQFPHITISCAENIRPVYSNELFEKAFEAHMVEIFDEPLYIEVTEGYVDNSGNTYLN